MVGNLDLQRNYSLLYRPHPPLIRRQQRRLTQQLHIEILSVKWHLITRFLTVLENASGSAAFTGTNPDDGILLTCQKDIPKPALSTESKEAIRIGTIAATLYHTPSASPGASIDSLIFRHPGTKLDIFLAGSGEAFRKLISSITLIP